MATPTLRYRKDLCMYEVTYAGMCRRHAQDWQALIWYHMALAMYAAHITTW